MARTPDRIPKFGTPKLQSAQSKRKESQRQSASVLEIRLAWLAGRFCSSLVTTNMIRVGLFLTLMTLIALSACSRPVTESGSKRIASETVVRAAPQRTEISAGGSGEAIVRMTIDKGYHVNANPPTYAYLKPTELVISPANGISVDSVSYPKALSKKFDFEEKPLAVYEGEAELKALLQADKSAARGEQSISATLRIQACDDHVCYPPGTIDLQIPVTIK